MSADACHEKHIRQIRGYVSDLNSVVGVAPVDPEEDVRRVQRRFERANPGGHFDRGTGG